MQRYTGQDTGLLTFHRTHNFGAFLQAYAMTRVLARAGFAPYVIDYQDRTQWLGESWPVILRFRRPVRFLDFASKRKAYGNTLDCFSLTPYTRDPADLLNLHFPRLVVGSDIVWNYLMHGCESPFFGNVGADRRIAYAPSFGWASLSDPPPAELAAKLKRFDAISVRDVNSQEIVKAVSDRDVPVVLDPTFLWDFDGLERRPQASVFRNSYLLVYAFNMTTEVAAQLRRFAEFANLKIIGVGYRLKRSPCDRTLMGLSPFEFLWAVKHAAYVFTNTFHGTIFCIKYAKAFAVSAEYYSVRPKLEHLLQCTGLMQRVVGSGVEFGEVLIADTDFTRVHAWLDAEADRSHNWLMDAIAS